MYLSEFTDHEITHKTTKKQYNPLGISLYYRINSIHECTFPNLLSMKSLVKQQKTRTQYMYNKKARITINVVHTALRLIRADIVIYTTYYL